MLGRRGAGRPSEIYARGPLGGEIVKGGGAIEVQREACYL
jgi:hypothetical protein